MADKVRLFLKPPGWNPPDLGGFAPAPEVGPAPVKFHVAIPLGLQAYVLLQFAVVLTAGSLFMFHQQRMDFGPRAAVAAAIVASLLVLGALLEARPWAFAGETARLACAAIGGLVLAGAGWTTGLALVPVATALRAWVRRFRPQPGRSTVQAPQTA